MKSISYLFIAVVLLVVGCGRDSAPTPSDDQPTQRAADEASKKSGTESKEVVWKTSLLEDGYMFQDAQQFRGYVRRAEIVATGVLTAWDGTKGKVRIESVIHGKLNNKLVQVIATGGIVRPETGGKVLFLLAHHDGKLKLHSFCGACGLYNYSDDLTFLIKQLLKSTG